MSQGARQVIDNCLKVSDKDNVVIVTDVQTMDIAAALKDQAKERTESVSFFILEDFGERPLKEYPEELHNALEHAQVSILAAQSQEGEIDSLRMPFLLNVTRNKIRHAHMVGITHQIMEQGMAANYSNVERFSKQVYSLVKNVKEIKVTTRAGTDFTAQFDSKTPWIISDGRITEETWSNLPDGEVWTIVKSCSGKIVVDGVLGDYFSQKYGLLQGTPLILQIIDGRVRYIKCEDTKLKKDFEKYIEKDENANRIGEFAFGTNLAVKELIGNMAQDEKYPGIHIAVGHTYPERTGVKWSSSIHCDAVIRSPTVIIDGKKLMENGKYLI